MDLRFRHAQSLRLESLHIRVTVAVQLALKARGMCAAESQGKKKNGSILVTREDTTHAGGSN
jgi:hypothetical protein